MKNKALKIGSLALCAALLLGVGSVMALGDRDGTPAPAESAALTALAVESTEQTKTETVYVLTDASGEAYRRILSDAESGDLTYLDGGEGLPVALTVTYALDGETVAPEALAGRSGHVTIRFTYAALETQSVTVGGRRETIPVPYLAVTGLILDHDTFGNIAVTGGRVLDDGDRSIVLGYAFPGLQESLNTDQLELTDYVEIEADAVDFALGSVYALVSNSLFGELDTERFDLLDELTDAADELTDAMARLMDGADELSDGLGSLRTGANRLYDGVGQLADGLNTLEGNSAALNSGARQVFDSLLATANSQLAAAGLPVAAMTVENYGPVLNTALAELNADAVTAAAEAKVEAAVREQTDAVRQAVTAAVEQEVSAQVTAAVRAGVEEQVLAAMGMSREQYDAAQAAGLISEQQAAQLAAAVEQQMASETVQGMIAANTAAQMATEEIAATVEAKTEEQIQLLIAQNLASDEVQAQIAAGLAQVSAAAEAVGELKAQLDSYNAFYLGLAQYTAGVDAAAQGADTLRASTPELLSGIDALREGMNELADGLKEFNEQGIEKLADAVNGDLSDLAERLEAVADTAGDASARYIFKTDSIG